MTNPKTSNPSWRTLLRRAKAKGLRPSERNRLRVQAAQLRKSERGNAKAIAQLASVQKAYRKHFPPPPDGPGKDTVSYVASHGVMAPPEVELRLRDRQAIAEFRELYGNIVQGEWIYAQVARSQIEAILKALERLEQREHETAN